MRRYPALFPGSGVSMQMIALLRGVNVGTANRLAMADLRGLLIELGYGDVRTLLNSGNAIFTVPASSRGDDAAQIEAALLERLGVRAPVVLLEVGELEAALAANPLRAIASDPSKTLIVVLGEHAALSTFEPVTTRAWEPEAIATGNRVLYVWCPEAIHTSPLYAALTKVLRTGGTARNVTTLQKLVVLAKER